MLATLAGNQAGDQEELYHEDLIAKGLFAPAAVLERLIDYLVLQNCSSFAAVPLGVDQTIEVAGGDPHTGGPNIERGVRVTVGAPLPFSRDSSQDP